MELLDLAKRCEESPGPSFRLEADISETVQPDRPKGSRLPNYTYSVDMALALIPNGMGMNMQGNGDCWYAVVHGQSSTKCHSPALAICAAALRARALPVTPQ